MNWLPPHIMHVMLRSHTMLSSLHTSMKGLHLMLVLMLVSLGAQAPVLLREFVFVRLDSFRFAVDNICFSCRQLLLPVELAYDSGL